MNLMQEEIYDHIHSVLLKHDFLHTYHLSEDFISSHLNDPFFIQQLMRIVKDNDFSCQRIFSMCEKILEELWRNNSPQNPLYYIYQYTLSLSFPHSVEIELYEDYDFGCIFYLEILRILSVYQKKIDDNTWQSKYPLLFLSSKEIENLKNPKEYKTFVKIFERDYIYEMMKLNGEVIGHNTLDHICGVHYLALFIGRQLFNLGVPIDLGRVSGAAAGHDIGKYGCRSFESKRVAYLHYYYTDMWFKNHDIPYIGNVALNHSVWDLEIENLSLESLILIYCDFRVKNVFTKDNKVEMHIFSLKDAFDVILQKLDNVDNKKERRYSRVYLKLADFEDYMNDIGVTLSPDLSSEITQTRSRKFYPLMHGNDIIQNIKYTSIRHNTQLMYKLRDEVSLNEILELARSEKDPKILREFLDIFDEYSTYFTQKQKIITMKFLYEKLIHSEEDIRKQCAELLGSLIGMFDEDYRKEVPEGICLDPPSITSITLLEKYLSLFIYPDHKMIAIHRNWIRYAIGAFLSKVFSRSTKNHSNTYKKVILKYYSEVSLTKEKYLHIDLLEALKQIPLIGDTETTEAIFLYIKKHLNSKVLDLRISALDTIYDLIEHILKSEEASRSLISYISDAVKHCSIPAENYIKLKIAKAIGVDDKILNQYKQYYQQDLDNVAHIFLGNLKTATHWVTKKIHVEMLVDYTLENRSVDKLYTAMHFCNLIKVSAVEHVRNRVGEALVQLFPLLPVQQRNDIAIELLRALEIEGYQFSKYIPHYLGQIIVYLQPVELDEILDDLIEKIKQSNIQIISLLLKTVGIFVSNYPKYKHIFTEDPQVYDDRFKKLLGILLNGLVHERSQIRQISFSVIGKEIFGSSKLTLREKCYIFQLIGKKILTLLTDQEERQIVFLTNSAGLNHIYRFISDHTFFIGKIEITNPKKVAFFPGSFDPFTLGHKEISKEIRNLGFEVYLAVDEFSWSKRTQPNLLRKNIINMSIANEMNIFLYPENFPVNIAYDEDLKLLKDNFKDSDIYIVTGSDVILSASAYKQAVKKHSIHSFPHVIFERRSGDCPIIKDRHLALACKNIQGDIIKLNLPPQYEDISSTQIRSYIDENRDISKLIDPLAQSYIYGSSLYRKEPQYKSIVQTVSIDIDVRTNINYELMNNVSSIFHKSYNTSFKNIESISTKSSSRLILIRDVKQNGKIIAYSIFHWLPSDSIYEEFKNSDISQCIRENYSGRIILIDGIFACANNSNGQYDLEYLYQVILTETLAFCLKNDYGFAVFHNHIDEITDPKLIEILKFHGFEQLNCDHSNPVLTVSMTNPCTLNLDIETTLKEPFKSNKKVKKAILTSRRKLQHALTQLYPGNLVLSFERTIMDEALVKKICRENGVPPTPVNPRKLGDSMCVPFGNILNRATVPNTVTKSLHIEKMFYPDMKSFSIKEFPYYLDIENQIKMIRSFNRDVILIDDLLNKGYRMKAIHPLLKNANVKVSKTIVGILTGRGKDLMEIKNREVDSAYFIPKLRLWFNESIQYPFIGGDTLWRGTNPQKNLLPSVNLILPYTSPHFIKGVNEHSLYLLSKTCIENSIDILKTLESEYQKLNERKLTLSLMGEVFIYPRCVDHGNNINYDLNMNPSTYLKNDLELLKRLEHSFTLSSTGR